MPKGFHRKLKVTTSSISRIMFKRSQFDTVCTAGGLLNRWREECIPVDAIFVWGTHPFRIWLQSLSVETVKRKDWFRSNALFIHLVVEVHQKSMNPSGHPAGFQKERLKIVTLKRSKLQTSASQTSDVLITLARGCDALSLLYNILITVIRLCLFLPIALSSPLLF